jgi:hypothetical protein
MTFFGPGRDKLLQISSEGFVIATDLNLEIAKGNISDHLPVEKFGRNPDVDSAAVEDVWDGGGVWVPPTVARVHDLASTNNNDTDGGTGARTVQVYGLDASGELANEIVTLAGTANAATAGTYSMIHRMIVRSAGTIEANAGDIKATAQTDSTVTAQITTGNSQTLMAIYQIPSDKTGYISSWYASMNRNNTTGAADIRLMVKPPGEVYQVKRVRGLVGAGNSSFDQKFDFPTPVAASSIIKVGAGASADNTDISAGFAVLLEDN